MFSLSSSTVLTISVTLTALQLLSADAHPAPAPASEINTSAVEAAVKADTTTPAELLAAELLLVVSSIEALSPTVPKSLATIITEAGQPAATSITEATTELEQFVEDGLLTYTAEEIEESGTSPPASINLQNTSEPIYPKKCPKDAPYSLSKDALQSAIEIPTAFTHGKKHPIIIVPGTAATTNDMFANNLFKLLAGDPSFANDFVWINNPTLSRGDAQVNAEYVAYAINYISGISGNSNVSVIAWSQGTSNTQWSLKYWPSTREAVSDFIALSPEFHGSYVSDLICDAVGCPPGFFQHKYESNYIAALRSNNGDSAYVPTTSIWSSTDPGTSGEMLDVLGVGVTNNVVQTLCPDEPAGSAYTHEGILFNPLTWALVKNALSHAGPGSLTTAQLKSLCAEYAPAVLDATDVRTTLSVSVVQEYNIFAYPDQVTVEPKLKSYVNYTVPA